MMRTNGPLLVSTRVWSFDSVTVCQYIGGMKGECAVRRNKENNANRLDLSGEETIALAEQLIAVGNDLLANVVAMKGELHNCYAWNDDHTKFEKDEELQRIRNAICWKASRVEQIAYRLRIDAGIWSYKRKLV